MDELIFTKTRRDSGTKNYIPKMDIDISDLNIDQLIPAEMRKGEKSELQEIPAIPEIEIMRHFLNLSHKNYCVDQGIYPLGSCTMKYNPKISEKVTRMGNFANIHPLQPQIEGNLEVIEDLKEKLAIITGMDAVTLQPAAGAQGEFTGILTIKKYMEENGMGNKNKIIVPDSSHGTNPATAAMCGYSVIELKSNEHGEINLEELEFVMKQGDVAGIMLTNPSTLGLFERQILKITEIIHKYEGLCYYDGANLNAILGVCRPGDMGFDIVHLNLHKTFSTPHGGGGPGSGPVGVKKHLAKYLPEHGGRVRTFYGNFGIYLRAYCYILALGDELRRVAERAVLNANYLRISLKEFFDLPYDRICMHEFVLSQKNLPNEITTEDIAKRLLDYGVHSPTMYFPLIVDGAIMIEPTETESLQELGRLIDAFKSIYEECDNEPDVVKKAPHNTPIGRLDSVHAARKPVLKWTPKQSFK